MTEVLKPSSKENAPKTLGEFLATTAKKQGLSVEALAGAAKLHPSTIERAFENGGSRTSTIFRLFRTLNLSSHEATQTLSKFGPQKRFWFIR